MASVRDGKRGVYYSTAPKDPTKAPDVADKVNEEEEVSNPIGPAPTEAAVNEEEDVSNSNEGTEEEENDDEEEEAEKDDEEEEGDKHDEEEEEENVDAGELDKVYL